MKKDWQHIRTRGFSLVEVILASSVFALIVMALVGALLYGQESTRLAGRRAQAVFFAEEALEAVRNMRDAGFANLIDGTYGITSLGNQWSFTSPPDVRDIFSRNVTISSIDVNTKEVVAEVSWEQTPQRTGSVFLTTHFTNWFAPVGETPSGGQADSLVVDTTNAALDVLDASRVIGITIENADSSDITVDRITLSWTGVPGNRRIEEIIIDGSSVWTGSGGSGGELDISDFTLAGGETYAIDVFDFNRSMGGATLTITFTMIDGSAKTVSDITL